MIELGLYSTRRGDTYACNFFPEGNFAEALGPLQGVGAAPVAAKVEATSEEEACEKLSIKLGPGSFY